MSPVLVSIPYSPWSRRTRIALRRMRVPVELRAYTPTLSEPWLRWRLRRPFGRVTVPVLFWDGPPLTDSLEIVFWGSDRSDEPLAEPSDRGVIRDWNTRADRALEAGRLLTTTVVLGDEMALRASLPPPVARLGPVGRAIGRSACRGLLAKYPVPGGADVWRQTLHDYCAALDEALDGGDHLLGKPSYADITAAAGLSFVLPDAGAHLADGARSAWTQPSIAQAFPDLLAWRDRTLR